MAVDKIGVMRPLPTPPRCAHEHCHRANLTAMTSPPVLHTYKRTPAVVHSERPAARTRSAVAQ